VHVIGPEDARHFSVLFDRAVSACATAQQLAIRCRESHANARASRASARRVRARASETLAAWAQSNAVFAVMRHEVEAVAHEMRREGLERLEAAAAVRAHMRFVMYDGGMREQEAESVIARANEWVDEVYLAA
jgi:hypothetical protein